MPNWIPEVGACPVNSNYTPRPPKSKPYIPHKPYKPCIPANTLSLGNPESLKLWTDRARRRPCSWVRRRIYLEPTSNVESVMHVSSVYPLIQSRTWGLLESRCTSFPSLPGLPDPGGLMIEEHLRKADTLIRLQVPCACNELSFNPSVSGSLLQPTQFSRDRCVSMLPNLRFSGLVKHTGVPLRFFQGGSPKPDPKPSVVVCLPSYSGYRAGSLIFLKQPSPQFRSHYDNGTVPVG